MAKYGCASLLPCRSMITVAVFLHLGLNKIDLRLLSVALSHSELAGQLLINAVPINVKYHFTHYKRVPLFWSRF